jgi:hypothetical protein
VSRSCIVITALMSSFCGFRLVFVVYSVLTRSTEDSEKYVSGAREYTILSHAVTNETNFSEPR